MIRSIHLATAFAGDWCAGLAMGMFCDLQT